jgi:hypothetical protein
MLSLFFIHHGYQPFVGPWPLLHFRNLFYTDGRKAATYTQDNTNTEQMHTNINALRGIRTHDPSVRASEESSYLRPRSHRDRHVFLLSIAICLMHSLYFFSRPNCNFSQIHSDASLSVHSSVFLLSSHKGSSMDLSDFRIFRFYQLTDNRLSRYNFVQGRGIYKIIFWLVMRCRDKKRNQNRSKCYCNSAKSGDG